MSDLEDAFIAAWRIAGSGPLITEYQFDENRKFRFDFAHVESKVGVELEGGIFGRRGGKVCSACGHRPTGRHSRGMGFHEDCNKYNLAALNGWVIARFTAKHLKESPMQCVETVCKLIGDRTGHGRKTDGPENL